MTIKLFITGGTIDVNRINPATNKYFFTKTHLPEMLKQAKNKTNIKLETLMLKHSGYMADLERREILHKCKLCKENRVIIAHGTATMIRTAQILGKSLKNKTVVLTGSFIPYNQEDSDALFNLGGAIIAVQTLPKGIYIVMNGQIFSWNNVQKNKKLERFEKLNKFSSLHLQNKKELRFC